MLWLWGRDLPWGLSGYDYTPGAAAVNGDGAGRSAIIPSTQETGVALRLAYWPMCWESGSRSRLPSNVHRRFGRIQGKYRRLDRSRHAPFHWLHPETILPNTAKRAVNLAATSTEFRAVEDFFVLREDLAADAKVNIRLKNGEQENLCWRTLWVQQCRKKDIGVEDNANHCFTG